MQDSLRFLLSPEAEPLLALARELAGSPLERVEALRRRTTPERAAAAAEQADLQIRARAKFRCADHMRFDRDALEVATGERVAAHRAERFRGYPRVADLTCGIGGDLLALSAAADCIGLDRSPDRLAMARHNLTVHGRRALLACADTSRWFPRASAYFLDPYRRPGGRRVTQLSGLEPGVEVVHELLRVSDAVAVKLSPALDYSSLPWPAEVEVVSERGECKEVVLWLGALRTAERRATLLPSDAALVARGDEPAPLSEPLEYLLEPDAAVVRAHLVDELAHDLGAAKLDPSIAYLTAGHRPITPFASCYRVLESRPFALKDLRSRLRSLGYGRAVVKKRGVAYDPADIARRLRLSGEGREAVVVLTRLRERAWSLICEPCGEASSGGRAAAKEEHL